jgi:glycosyltransferase involved in cell wall biosynthesis/LmbE family N-acetylglucosaminyl deacetylase
LESDLIPYTAAASLPAHAALVLAPHPDDEVFGCGGAIVRHVHSGVPVHVVVLTDGARFGDANGRVSESRAAARVLGYGEPEFWSLPDRSLRYSNELVQRIADQIIRTGADLVYAPSPWEIHPDHRQTTWMAMEAVRRVTHPIRLAFYEVGAPLRPNVLLDITTYLATKEAAMRCFKSQLAQQDYIKHIQALNHYRTYTLPREVLAAEAYWVVTRDELNQATARNLFASVSPGQPTGAGPEMQSLPLVSVLIRSMDREFLFEALDSVALQTYPNIEVLVVAAGPDHRPLPATCGPFNLRLLKTELPLLRSRSANKALMHAKGSLLLFLDDDDWLMPGHVARLAHVFANQPHAVTVYTGISLVDIDGKPMGETFDLPFDAIRQLAGNLMPIHAVLFSAKVLEQGCRFDESLDRYEDWDFWLQLSKLAPMVHLPGVSGAYRIHESSGVHLDAGAAGTASGVVYEKWETHWSREQIGKIMHRAWSHPELQASLADYRLRLASVELDAKTLRDSMAHLQENHTQRALTLAQMESALAVRELSAARSDVSLSQRESSLARQESYLGERETTLTNKELLVTQWETNQAQQARAAADQKQAFDLLVKTSEEMAGQLARRTHDLAAVLGSRSWRLTSPVRWSTTKLRQFLWLQVVIRRSRRLLEIRQNQGAIGVWQFLRSRLSQSLQGDMSYITQVERSEESATREQSDALALKVSRMAFQPVISVVMPVYNPPLQFLKEAVESVREQGYSNWELCISDDASSDPGIRDYLSDLANQDKRIKLVLREKNGHIVAASNSALILATGEFVALLDHDDVLSKDALYWMAEAINRNPLASVLYSDEDKIGLDGKRCDPYFKSDWNLELFLSQNMISHLGVYRRSLLVEVGGFRPGYEGSQDYDLALRCVLKLLPTQIVHIPRVLYHWRISPGSTALSPNEKSYAQQAGHRALTDYLVASKLGGRVESLLNGFYRVHPQLPAELPLVSLIIPTRNAVQLVKQCVESILLKTTYQNYEILLIDNGSDDPSALAYFGSLNQHERIRVLRDDSEFNYAGLNNRAVKEAKGELIGLVNNDIEVIAPGWLDEMVGLVLRPGVGAVGARLWYPNDTLQHGGVIVGLGGVAGHAHWGIQRGDPGYFGRGVLTQVLSGVTAACLVVRKSVYEQVAGLDERNLKVAFNDVDFCLKLTEAGYRNIWTPYAELYHHESATRGADDSPEKKARFSSEEQYMHQRWGHKFSSDPYYNVNLTLTQPSFAPAWPPRLDNS